MYRLFKLKKLYLFSSKVVTSPYIKDSTKQTCSTCGHHFVSKPFHDFQHVQNPSSVRFQSTSIHTAVQNSAKMKKKKGRRTKKKYAELVEVTNNSSSQRKASVSKLKPEHLSQLVQMPNINLAQLYTLRNAKLYVPSENVSKEENLVPIVNAEASPLEEEKLVLEDRTEVSHVIGRDTLDDSLHEPLHSTAVKSLGNSEYKLLQTAIATDIEVLDNCKHELLQGDNDILEDKLNLMTEIQASPLEHDLLEEHSQAADDDLMDFDAPADENVASILPAGKKANKDKSKNKVKERPKYKISSSQKHREKLVKVQASELEKAAKEECLFRNLYSYLEVCVSCGLLNRALYSLLYYHSRIKHSRYSSAAKQIKLFNIVLHGFAKKGNLSKIQEIHKILHKDKVPMTPQTFAALFECIGHLPESTTENIEELLQDYVQEMKQKGFTLGDIMEKSAFVSDQRDVILDVIKRIEPAFQVHNDPPVTCYSCNLLKELNERNSNGIDVSYKSPAEGLVTTSELQEKAEEQFQIELNSYVKVKTIEKRNEPNETILYYREKLEETQKNWKKVISEAYQRDMKSLRAQHNFKSFRNINLYPYLRVLEPQDYMEIILEEIRKLAEGSETFSPTINQLHRQIGNQVRARYEIKYKRNSGILDKVKHLYNDYCDWYLNPESCHQKYLNTRQRWQYLEHENPDGPHVNLEEKAWPVAVLQSVGKFLYNIILRDIKIDVNIAKSSNQTPHLLPAFYSLFRSQGHVVKEEVKPHPVLAKLFRGAAQEDLVFEVTMVPMICPPLPWTSVTNGGYLVAKADLIRLPFQAVQQWHLLKETSPQQLFPSFDSLNQLASVPWTVNEPVLDVVIEVFNSGGSHRLDIPEPPSSCPLPTAVTPDMTKYNKFQVYRERMALRRQKAEMYSLWCDALYRLSLANHFRKRIFWLPHNMDFRGRVYPCPPHLNHLGADMARAILYFAKGEPLGPKGLDWLKIHVVNLTGLKKREPVSERLRYAEELMPEIMDSAQNPLTGRMWWAESEEPWQTLACCMEIVRAIESGDPENYVCHFPVHQDGSCNGLQHYAALGRDKAGAESVNLTPAESPQDVYSCVAALVERERTKDAEAGLNIAKNLEGYVRRKVIKQTVMTTVYGVTRFGARLQIARQLKDIDNFPKEAVWPGSQYLVAKTFESIQEMFTSTKEIQDWFTECARHISQVCGQNVEWVTPLGFPIVQPYSRHNKKFDGQVSGHKIKEQFALDMYERPNVMKQKNAFPPNFIHSLDSSHMMLTSLFCERSGITFVSVHDCFWTHPNTVDIMNKICRDQFVTLHSQSILEDLSDFLVEKYSYSDREFSNDGSVSDMTKRRLNKILRRLPKKGDFDLDCVLDSTYFFS